MDFTVDKENCTVKVKREFFAKTDTVWAAWTEQKILDQWWAPKPWKSRTKSMDFREGGHRLYAMAGPEGEEHWARADYKKITPKTSFAFLDAFCDSEGTVNEEFPRSDWRVDFAGLDESTTVYIEIKHEKISDLEMIIQMGFKKGFTLAMEGLDEILQSKTK